MMVSRLAVVLGCVLAACDKQTSTTPAPMTPLPNQAPRIVATVTPEFGVSQVTTFTARVEVTDPDGDPVSASRRCPTSVETPLPLTNGVTTISFKAGPPDLCGSFQLFATDARGAQSETRVGTSSFGMDGSFRLVIGTVTDWRRPVTEEYGVFGLSLRQRGTEITGMIIDSHHRGTVDAAAPGSIDADGRFQIRFKIEGDFELSGELTGAVRDLKEDKLVGVGVVKGPRYAGKTFQLWVPSAY